jgi:hypothetical protein
LLDGLKNLLKHSICISQNVVVPETQNAKTSLLQISVTDLVLAVLDMLTAVRFNNEHLFERHEVNNPRSERHLPTEFDVCKLSRPKKPPELPFGIGQRVAQMACLASFWLTHSILRHVPLTRLAHYRSLGTLSHKGRG